LNKSIQKRVSLAFLMDRFIYRTSLWFNWIQLVQVLLRYLMNSTLNLNLTYLIHESSLTSQLLNYVLSWFGSFFAFMIYILLNKIFWDIVFFNISYIITLYLTICAQMCPVITESLTTHFLTIIMVDVPAWFNSIILCS